MTIGSRRQHYLVSFALPRFFNQSLKRSSKERFYRRADDGWIAKLDTVIHELYHIDPGGKTIRCVDSARATYTAQCHGDEFLAEIAEMVGLYFDSHPARHVRFPALFKGWFPFDS